MKNIVADLRKERGLTQLELAEQLGVSRQTVVAIEQGRFNPSLPVAFRLSAVLNKTVEELFQQS